jgi:hypothetical protein
MAVSFDDFRAFNPSVGKTRSGGSANESLSLM